MQTVSFDMIADFAMDPENGWSIGSFGAIGEFVRDAGEPVTIRREPDLFEITTARGAMRIAPTEPLGAIAWDSLSSDGESWGHALAFCCPCPQTPTRVIRSLGADGDAIREEDRTDRLFDLGVGSGVVRMALRTSDVALITALEGYAGQSLLSASTVMEEVLRAQPHRVLLSPAGRIEIFQPIPPADGKSPVGPHTHLLVKLVARDRPHSSNIPIPNGLQSALSLHPRSPWRTMLGERHDFKPHIDEAFAPLLDRFGLSEDQAVDHVLRKAIEDGATPEFADWPDTRRGRTKARIVLRRMAAAGERRVAAWRAVHDRQPVEEEEGEGVLP
ncbi:MAG TPA: hypothetical protein VF503_07505 [Sphingobium sp.]|uniref:DUF6925 family protein n=1 Tax=Sphingobium sp. TaxID=1912891 RepID=UPI002ECFEF74